MMRKDVNRGIFCIHGSVMGSILTSDSGTEFELWSFLAGGVKGFYMLRESDDDPGEYVVIKIIFDPD